MNAITLLSTSGAQARISRRTGFRLAQPPDAAQLISACRSSLARGSATSLATPGPTTKQRRRWADGTPTTATSTVPPAVPTANHCEHSTSSNPAADRTQHAKTTLNGCSAGEPSAAKVRTNTEVG